MWANFPCCRTSSRLQQLAGYLATRLTGYPVVPSLASGFSMPAEDVVKVFKRFDKDAWQIGDVVGPQVAIPVPVIRFFGGLVMGKR